MIAGRRNRLAPWPVVHGAAALHAAGGRRTPGHHRQTRVRPHACYGPPSR